MEQSPEQEKEWLKLVQKQIYTILISIIPDKSRRLKYVTSQAMKLWAKALTFESYSPQFNYENIEFEGDKVAGATFAKYINKRFPGLSESELTELNRNFNSTETQHTFADRLGLSPLLRIVGMGVEFTGYTNLPVKIKADIYEAFLGTLFEVSDQYDVLGAGFINCYNITVQLYNTISIDVKSENLWGHPKTRVQQLLKFYYEGVRYPVVKDETVRRGEFFHSTISLSDKHVKLFRELGIRDLPIIIGEAKSLSSRSASNLAYVNALNTLTKYGITKEFIEKLKNISGGQYQQQFDDLFRQAEEIAARDGYIDLVFRSFKKLNVTATETLFLTGKIEDGREFTLSYITVQQVGKDESGSTEWNKLHDEEVDRVMRNRIQLLQTYIADRTS